MTISAVAADIAGISSSTTASDNTALSSDYNTFLQLLTTQLQNQDPTQPTDTSQFTQQLVEYSQVEQQIDTNTKLDTLNQLQVNTKVQAALSMIGKDVQFGGNSFSYNGGDYTVDYNLPSNAAQDTINITDANGDTIYTTTGSLTSGNNSFIWDGSTNEGTQAQPGTYNVVVSALDPSGNPITATTSVWGQVVSMDASGTDIQLMLNGGGSVLLNNVSDVQNDPGSSSTTTSTTSN